MKGTGARGHPLRGCCPNQALALRPFDKLMVRANGDMLKLFDFSAHAEPFVKLRTGLSKHKIDLGNSPNRLGPPSWVSPVLQLVWLSPPYHTYRQKSVPPKKICQRGRSVPRVVFTAHCYCGRLGSTKGQR